MTHVSKKNTCCICIWIVALIFILSSCAHLQKGSYISADITAESDRTENISWHSCSFRITWPEGSAPDLDVDLLLAHAVIGPVLDTYEERLKFWRFHRRASRDEAGHLFSFIFFTNQGSAKYIKEMITVSNRVRQLKSENIIEELSCDNVTHWSGPDITDTSDQNWSFSVQKNWPFFIMGVSKLWLGLIEDALPEFKEDQLAIRQLLDEYRKANRIVTNIWQKEGQHAFLHHLNAVFGYESLLIRY